MLAKSTFGEAGKTQTHFGNKLKFKAEQIQTIQ